MTYPASIIAPYDEWFSEPILTETQMEYQKLMKESGDNIIVNMDGGVGGSWKVETEPVNIHEVMYDMATKTGKTTTQLDPIGGSENFHQDSGGMTSGNSFGEF
jgi:hypothetical protein